MAEKRKKRKKKNNKGPLIFIIIVVICIIIFAILFFTGRLNFNNIENVVNNKTAVAYIDYSDSDNPEMTINSEGRVLDALAEAPEDIPLLTGLEFTKILKGDLLEYENASAYDYAMDLVMALRKYEIGIREINIDGNDEASAYVNDVTILFGLNEKTEQKVADLSDFFDQVKDLKGTLHMEEVNERVGYTFKQEKDKDSETPVATVQSETTTKEEEESSEDAEEYVEGDVREWQEDYEEPYVEEWQEWPEEEYYYEEGNEEVYVEEEWQ